MLLTYELVDVAWSFTYDFDVPFTSLRLCEADDELDIPAVVYDTDAEGIPLGQSIQEILLRQQIISQFYYNWKLSHPEKRVFNKALNEFINIRQISIEEAKEHSAKSYKSTKAFMMLDEVLAKAEKIAEVPTKPGNKNQSRFSKLLILSYTKDGLGTVKLTVGVLRSTKDKVQYGITTLRPDQPLVESPQPPRKKKKASHK